MSHVEGTANGGGMASSAEVPRFKLSTWRDFLDSPDRLEWLLFIGTYYRELFDEAMGQIRNLAPYEQVMYLIDFDLLQTYLEGHSNDRRGTFLISSWFHFSTRPYALPVGAFEELMGYLRRMGAVKTRTVDLNQCGLGREAAVRTLAESLGVTGAEKMATDEATSEIAAILEDSTVRLGRLVDFLTDERFVGIARDYSDELAEEFTRWISDRPRRTLEGRRMKDERDGRNVAIALESLRRVSLAKEEGAADVPPAQFLVSRTTLLLDISKTIRQHILEHEPAGVRFCERMASIFRKMKGGLCERNLLELPIIHPRHATVAELIGFYDSHRDAFASLKDRRRELWEITEYCEDMLDMNRSLGGRAREGLVAVIRENREKVAKILQRFSRQFLGEENSGLSRLEDTRSTMIGVGLSTNLLGNEENAATAQEALSIASTRFVSEISRVDAQVAELGIIDYATETAKSNTVPEYTHYSIVDQTDRRRKVTLMSGEVYQTVIPGTRDLGTYYVVRWVTYASPADFVRSLEDVVFPGFSGPVLIGSELQPLAICPECWSEGLVVHTAEQSLGVPLEVSGVNVPFKTEKVLTAVSRLVEGLRVPKQVYGTSVNVLPTVMQYRVNTKIGDFLFDVEPAEGEVRKYCSVISHLDLRDVIPRLYGWLGTRYAVNEELEAALREALRQCRSLPENGSPTEQAL